MNFHRLIHPRLGLVLGYDRAAGEPAADTPPAPKPAPSPPLPDHVARQALNPKLLAVHVAGAHRPRPGAAWE